MPNSPVIEAKCRERPVNKRERGKLKRGLNRWHGIATASFRRKPESSARNARGIGDTLSGTYRVLDPATNEYTTVQAGANFYYRVNRTDTVYGSNLAESRVDVTRMLRIDWDR